MDNNLINNKPDLETLVKKVYIKEIKTERFKIKKFSLNLVNNNYLNWLER